MKPSAVMASRTADFHSMGSAVKGLFDRGHYGGDTEHHYYYGGDSGGSSHSSKKDLKKSLGLSALTLLAFLFFLNILQNCIEEHIDDMNPTTQANTIVMVGRTHRLEDENLARRSSEEVLPSVSSTTKPKAHKRRKEGHGHRADAPSKSAITQLKNDEMSFQRVATKNKNK